MKVTSWSTGLGGGVVGSLEGVCWTAVVPAIRNSRLGLKFTASIRDLTFRDKRSRGPSSGCFKTFELTSSPLSQWSTLLLAERLWPSFPTVLCSQPLLQRRLPGGSIEIRFNKIVKPSGINFVQSFEFKLAGKIVPGDIDTR